MGKIYHLTGPEQLTPEVVKRINGSAAKYENDLKRGVK